MITLDDIKKRGYDLTLTGRLLQGDFTTIEEAANQFIEECCNTIWGLIEKNRGYKWANLFKKDMLDENLTDKLGLLYRQALKTAMLEQTIFIYENGDKNASAIRDDTRVAYSPKALNKLYTYGIIHY